MTQSAGLESAARAGPGPTHFSCFDGLRALAALAVLTTHVAFLTGVDFRPTAGMFTSRLDVGVAVFFVISGFLLYRPFVAARFAGAPEPRWVPFLWRRALRIFPAYWLALTMTVFVFDQPPKTPGSKELFLDYALLHSYSLGHLIGPILSSYTLVTEVSFYLFLPVYAALLAFRPAAPERQLRRELLAVGALFAAGVIYRVTLAFLTLAPTRDSQLQNILPGWIDVFASGMALAVVSAWVAHRGRVAPAGLEGRRLAGVAWTIAGLAFVLVCVAIGPTPRGIQIFSIGDELLMHYLYLVVGLFFVLPAVFGDEQGGPVRRLLRNPLVAWLGLVSYGLYLWNETLLEKYLQWTDSTAFAMPFLPTMIGVAALTTVAAASSYYLVERNVLRLKHRAPQHRSKAVAAR
jgi:peptidoglycan/LPS O-acetylase OafA/YrhL